VPEGEDKDEVEAVGPALRCWAGSWARSSSPIRSSRGPRAPIRCPGFPLYIELSSAFLGAVLVLVIGGMWRRSKQAAHAERVQAAE
jgi:hypothetical protein